MSASQYFNNDYSNQYVPGSPDTFFPQVNIQPPSSDSAQTPPSPSPSKSRRAVARPTRAQPPLQASSDHHNSPTSYSIKRHSQTTSASNATSPTSRKEKERQLANTPREALIQLAITKDGQSKEAKVLLSSAVLQVESLQDRLAHEKNARKALEDEIKVLGMKTTKAILDAQKESTRAKEDIGHYRLQLENMSRDLQRANQLVQNVEQDREEADKSLARARATARQLKEQNILLQAREEGRKEGFQEGLRQGQKQIETLQAQVAEREDNENSIEASAESRGHKGSSSKPTSHRTSRRTSQPTVSVQNINAVVQAEVAKAIAVEQKTMEQMSQRFAGLSIEADRERDQRKTAERQRDRLAEEKTLLEREKRNLVEELERSKRARRDLERDTEDMKRDMQKLHRDRDELRRAQSLKVRKAEEDKRKVEEEKDKEIKELRKERDRLRMDLADLDVKAREDLEKERERVKELEEERTRHLAHERGAEGERKALKTELDAALAALAAVKRDEDLPPFKSLHEPVSRLKMPDPPSQTMNMPNPIVMPSGPSNTEPSQNAALGPSFPVPRTGSTASQRHGRDRRGSVSSVVSSVPYDLLQLPSERLSRISEESSGKAPSPDLPSWAKNPPVDHARAESRAGQYPSGSWGVGGVVEQPQWPTPAVMPQGPEAYLDPTNPQLNRQASSTSVGSYQINIVPPSRKSSNPDLQEQWDHAGFLSTRAQPSRLPQSQHQQHQPNGREQYTSGVTTQPNSPAVSGRHLPHEFIEARGRATPIWQRNTLPNAPPVMPQGPYIPPEMSTGASTLRGFGDGSGATPGEGMPQPNLPGSGPTMPESPFIPPDMPTGTSTMRGFGDGTNTTPGQGMPQRSVHGMSDSIRSGGISMPEGPYVPPEMPTGASTLRGFGDHSGATPGEGMPKPVIPRIMEDSATPIPPPGSGGINMPQGPYKRPDTSTGMNTWRGFGRSDVPMPGNTSEPLPVIPGVRGTATPAAATPRALGSEPLPVIPGIRGRTGPGPSMPQGPYIPPDMSTGGTTLRGHGTPVIPPPAGPSIPEPNIPGGKSKKKKKGSVSMPEGPYVPPPTALSGGTSSLRGHGDLSTPSPLGPAIPEPNIHAFGSAGTPTPGGRSVNMPEAPYIPPEMPTGTSTLRGHGDMSTPSPLGPSIPEPTIPGTENTPGASAGVGMPEAPFIPPEMPTGMSTLRGHGDITTPSPHGPSIPEPTVPGTTATPGANSGVGMPEAPSIPPDVPTGTSTLRGHGNMSAPSPHGPSIPEPSVSSIGKRFDSPEPEAFIPPDINMASFVPGHAASSSSWGMPEPTVPKIIPGPDKTNGPTNILKGKKKYGNPTKESTVEPPSLFGGGSATFGGGSSVFGGAPVFPSSPASVQPLGGGGVGWAAPVFPSSPSVQAQTLGSSGWGAPVFGSSPAPSVKTLGGSGWGTGPVFPSSPAGSVKPLGTGPAWGTPVAGRTSIYGPPASTLSPNPAPSISMPEATVPVTMPEPTIPQIIPEEDNGFDQTTINNTKLNSTSAAIAKKKKKKK